MITHPSGNLWDMANAPIRLWLDDNRPAPEGWVRATTAEQAEVLMMTHPVEALSLDYDLDAPECRVCQFQCGLREGGCQSQCDCHGQGDETGLDFLNWMISHGRWPMTKPEVHSANLDGSLRMKALVEQHWPYN